MQPTQPNPNQFTPSTDPVKDQDNTFGTPDLSQVQRENQQAQQSHNRRLARWAGVGMALILILLMGGGTYLLVRKQKNIHNSSVVDRYDVSNIPLDSLNSNSQTPVADQTTDKLSVNGNLVVGGKITLSSQAIDDIAAGLSNKVSLQDASPGTAQVGNVNIAGTLIAGLVQGSGAGLTSLNASSLATGTVDNARLSTTVTRLGQTIPLSAIQPTILSSLNNITSNGGNIDVIAGSNVTVTSNGTNKTITISAAGGSGDISGVTAGDGLQGGGTSGTVTVAVDGTVARLSGASANSQTFVGNNQIFKNNIDSTTAFVIQNAAGTNNILVADSLNNRLAVNQAAANYALDINGDVNLTAGNAFRINGAPICTSGGCSASAGSGNYIQNSTSQQVGANFNFESASTGSVGGVIKGKSGQTADLLRLQDGNGANVASFNAQGGLILQTTTNWSSALSVRDSYSNSFLNVNSAYGVVNMNSVARIKLGTSFGYYQHTMNIMAFSTGGVLPAATYEYRLTEITHGAGNSEYESIAWPASPSTVTTTGSTSRISISWSTVVEDSAYRLYRTDDGGATWSSLDLSGSTSFINDDGNNFVWTPGATAPPIYRDAVGSKINNSVYFGAGTAAIFSDKGGNISSSFYYDLDSDNLVIDSTNDGHATSISGLLLKTNKTTVKAATDSTSVFAVKKLDDTTILNVDSTNARVGIGIDAPIATLDVRPTAVGELGYFLRQYASSTADMLQLQNSSSVTVFNIDATGHLASGESLPGVPIIGVDPNSGADKGDLVNTDGPLKASAGSGLTLNISAGSAYTADIMTSPTKVKRCNLSSNTSLSLGDNTTRYIYVLAGGADSTTGTTCSFSMGSTPDAFNASKPTVVIAKVVTSGGSIVSVADTRFFAGGVLTYVQTSAAVEPGMVVKSDTSTNNQVQTTSVSGDTGVEGIIVVGNNAATRAIMMTSGSAWVQSLSSTTRANCAGTSTTAGAVVQVSAAVNSCVGRIKVNAAASTPSVLVQVAPN